MGSGNGSTVVLYHGPDCPDGFGAAYAAWTVLGDGATYVPVNYGKGPPPAAQVADRLFILDFSYPIETLLALADACEAVVVLDHHKTALEEVKRLERHLAATAHS